MQEWNKFGCAATTQILGMVNDKYLPSDSVGTEGTCDEHLLVIHVLGKKPHPFCIAGSIPTFFLQPPSASLFLQNAGRVGG